MIDIKGVSISQALEKGTPQRRVLSVIIWIIIFNELLILYKGKVEIIEFADDGSLIIRGKKLSKMYALMRKLWTKLTTGLRNAGLG